MSIVGRWFGIQCFKHDGSLHRCWDRALILENNKDFIVTATKRAKVVEEWWNAICMLKHDGICFYCNIASPSIISKDYIKYIDYDLDAKLFTNNEIRVLDEKEYAHHRSTYGYDDDLDAVLTYTIKLIVERMKNHEFPFDDEQIKQYFDQFLEMTKK